MSQNDNEVASPSPRQQRSSLRGGSVARRTVERIAAVGEDTARRRLRDVLATEEPLEIVIVDEEEGPLPLTVTMRTPGADFDLVAGFLFAEGVIEAPADIAAMRYCPGSNGGNEQLYNRVEVRLASRLPAEAAAHTRRFLTTSSCGVCGMSSIEAVLALGCPAVDATLRVAAETLLSLPRRLQEAQTIFQRTGGLHAAALFAADGTLVRLREDVGRHNAMDKLVGSSLLQRELPMGQGVVLLSGRLSFELVQKAARAGVPILAGVSAPSSLAVQLAERTGITLVGFLRESSFNIYTGGARIPGDALAAATVKP